MPLTRSIQDLVAGRLPAQIVPTSDYRADVQEDIRGIDSTNFASLITNPVSFTVPMDYTRRFIWLALCAIVESSDWYVEGQWRFESAGVPAMVLPVRSRRRTMVPTSQYTVHYGVGRSAAAIADVMGGSTQPPLILWNDSGYAQIPCLALNLACTRVWFNCTAAAVVAGTTLFVGARVISQHEST